MGHIMCPLLQSFFLTPPMLMGEVSITTVTLETFYVLKAHAVKPRVLSDSIPYGTLQHTSYDNWFPNHHMRIFALTSSA